MSPQLLAHSVTPSIDSYLLMLFLSVSNKIQHSCWVHMKAEASTKKNWLIRNQTKAWDGGGGYASMKRLWRCAVAAKKESLKERWEDKDEGKERMFRMWQVTGFTIMTCLGKSGKVKAGIKKFNKTRSPWRTCGRARRKRKHTMRVAERGTLSHHTHRKGRGGREENRWRIRDEDEAASSC